MISVMIIILKILNNTEIFNLIINIAFKFLNFLILKIIYSLLCF